MSASGSSQSTRSAASQHHPAAKAGALAATVCYLFWGVVPVYWKQLAAIDALELIAHRHVWSLLFVIAVIAVQGRLGEIRAALATPRSIGINLLGGALLTLNWLVYVWGVNTGHVVECSLGYFLVPLVNVAAGRFVLHEHLRRAQWCAIALAAVGVAVLVYQLGRLPWIALSLAATWGGYSLMRKKTPLGAVTGLTVETLLLAPLAIAFLVWEQQRGAAALGALDAWTHALLLSAGIITAIPLVLFAYGARRVRLTTLGLLQYLAPTVQFAIAIWLYREPFSREKLLSFGFIWMGLALYTVDNLLAQRQAASS